MNERYQRHMSSVQQQVIRGTDRRVDHILREENYPDHNSGRWLFQLLAEVQRLDQRTTNKRQREEVVIDVAEAWTDIAAIAAAAAVSCALVAFEDQEERIDDKVHQRIRSGGASPAAQEINAASPAPDAEKVPF